MAAALAMALPSALAKDTPSDSLAPILAPSIGGLILMWADWRVIFWVLAGYGAIALLVAWFFLPETLPPIRRNKQVMDQTRAFAGDLHNVLIAGTALNRR